MYVSDTVLVFSISGRSTDVMFTHISLVSFFWDLFWDAASDQGLHCLFTENYIKSKIKNGKNTPAIPKFENGSK